ncbi:maleylpyruvate isomerase family mycothiol-dependent enzyme [Georgenia subflava]|uniref:Maleylpyruvate isomerase family mycothiol-dependent enzyme n=1 Tax=Georgenia subflava TaxID=1622177 RepID=A0A6N7EG45_9MICO|nr:maleylpyruvate isomerase family mycothiol-dependent enzyme [Georgenia subflava]MPV36153.1 maleylpyruvate isomerase family mycothiol-dependent enzyme [Georgenia subflava]
MALTPAGCECATLVDVAVRDSAVALRTVLDSMERLDDAAVREPSHLPGWTRGHVLAHIDGVGSALARQAERAAVGERVPVYDGGRAGRDAAIDAHAGRSAREHLQALQALENRLPAAWPEPGSAGWENPAEYRQGTVADAALAWWREVRIHLVDLDAGVGPGSWDNALCTHLLEFLEPRLSDAGTVILVADNADVRHVVTGNGSDVAVDVHGTPDDAAVTVNGTPDDAAVTVHGSLQDLTAWLAGRNSALPRAYRGSAGAELPELGPWPSSR